MKTVLAPNAPWPTTPKEKPKAVARKRVLPPPKNASKQKRTDAMFEEWASKNKGTINEIH
jgi:hypothetical protein